MRRDWLVNLFVGFLTVHLSDTRAPAAILNWMNPVGGSAAISANWNPAQLPTAADDLTFNLNSSYTVTYGATVPNSRTHTYRLGTTTLNVASPHTVSNGVTIGSLVGDNATMTLTTGTLTSSGPVVIGGASGSTGTLNINDDDADFILTTSAGDLTVGNNGAGTLSITGGGLMQVADRFIAGANAASTANVTVSGFNLLPLAASTLTVDGTSIVASIGAGGDVTMNVANGAQVAFAGSVNIAQGSASTSTVTIGGAGFQDATLNVGGNLTIGGNQAAASAGGVGVLNINSDGALVVGGSLNVAGDPDGGTGTMNIANNSTVTTGSLAVGAGGTLALGGGTLDIVGGTLSFTNPSADMLVGGADGPVVTLRNGAQGTLQRNVSRALTVGGGLGARSGDFDVRSGSSLAITFGNVVLGESSDDDGGMIINGNGSSMTMPVISTLTVGQSGVGRFEAELGGSVTAGDVFIAQNATADGTVLIENAGTTAAFQTVFVGGSNAAAGGDGALIVNNNATCSVNSPATSVRVWPNGVLHVISAALNCAGEVNVQGHANLEGGSIAASRLTLSNATMEARGVIDASLIVSSTASSLTLTGDLTAGNPTDVNGFINSGTIFVGDHALTIRDANRAALNNTNLGPLGVVAAQNGIEIAFGFTLFGDGTIDADVFNFGTINGSGTGLTFRGIVHGVGQGFFGPTARFFNGGGFTGFGTIGSPILGDSEAVFTATGNLTMGNNTTPSGFDLAGELRAGSSTVTLLDQDRAVLNTNSLLTLNGGALNAANGLLLRSGGEISGRGAVNAKFTGEANTTINATGNLTIGSNVSLGFDTAGELHVGSNAVTLATSDSARLGALTTIAGGTLSLGGSQFFLLDPGEEILGFGTMNGPITTSIGSVITATGNLSIGRVASPAGLNGSGGELHIGPHTVTIINSPGSQAALGNLTTLDGGVLTCSSDLVLASLAPNTDELRGAGTVITPQLINAGIVSPGTPTGTLAVNGSYSQGSGANNILRIEIGGVGAGNFDRLTVTGLAVLDGTIEVDVINGFQPIVGAGFTVMTYAARSGDFATKIVPTDDPERRYTVKTFDTFVNVAVGLTGDMNCDGIVTPGDIAGFVLALTNQNQYAAQFPNCGVNNADINGDGVVSPSDIAGFVDLLTGL